MIKKMIFLPLFLTVNLVLTACVTTEKSKEEVGIPDAQQKTFLNRPTPPQQFGFSTYRIENGIAYSGSARLHPNHLATEKPVKEDIPIIKIQGKSKRLKMQALIDFSSPSSWLEFSTSQQFDAHFLGMDNWLIPYRGKANTGGHKAFASVVTQLRIKDLFIENIPFYTRMAINSLGPLSRGIKLPNVDAVLGYDNLRNFEYIQMNLRNEQISFSSTIPYVPHDGLVMTKARIVRLPGFGLAVEGAIDGAPMPILLDFAGDFFFSRGDVKVKTTKQVSLGDIVYRQVPTLVLARHNSPARAGRQMLNSYIITICNNEGVVYFERPPK